MQQPRAPLVLVIDDDEDVLLTISKLVRALGFDAVTASSGEQGVELFRGRAPDVVLLDFNMPKQDGNRTLTLLRRENSAAKVILMSGALVGTRGALDAMRKQGADAVLAKPFDSDELQQVLRSVLPPGAGSD